MADSISASPSEAPTLAPTHAPTTVIGSSIASLMQWLSVAEYLGTILLVVVFATYYFFPWLFRRRLQRYFEAFSQKENTEGRSSNDELELVEGNDREWVVRQKASLPSDKHKHTPPRGPTAGGSAHNSSSSGGGGSRSSLGSSFLGRYSSKIRGNIEYMAVGTQSSSMEEALPWDLNGDDDEEDGDEDYHDDDEVTSCEI